MDEKSTNSLVSVSDIFGFGKIADSKPVERLVEAIVSGIGRLAGPTLLRREVKTHLELQNLAEEHLSQSFSGELALTDRSKLTLRFEELRTQQNRENIARLAIEEMKRELPRTSEHQIENVGSVDLDWLSEFWSRASLASNEGFQGLWAKVLSREAISPGGISRRSLSIVSHLSRAEAEMIEALAPFLVQFERNPKRRLAAGILLDMGQYQGTFTVPKEFGYQEGVRGLIPDFDLVALDSAGIMQSSTGWAADYFIEPRPEIHMSVGSLLFVIEDLPPPNERFKKNYALGSGWGFTAEGCEIASIINAEPNQEYLGWIKKGFAAAGCKVSDVLK